MESVAIHAQQRALPASEATWPDAAWLAAGVERLAPLLADAGTGTRCDPLAGALAYIARYGREVTLLEHEWELLYAALLLAWRRGEDAAVVRLASALARVVGRVRDRRAAERALQLGIGASRRMQDRRHLVRLLNRLGGLLCAHGQRERGVRLWYTSLRLAETVAQGLWEPLRGFAVLVDLVGSYAGAHQLVESLQSPLRTPSQASRVASRQAARVEAAAEDAAESLAVALFARGLHARTMGEPVRAASDFRACLRLLAQAAPGAVAAVHHQLFLLAVQAELARAQGNYPRSYACTATALALGRIVADDYTLAALLVDQTFYAHEQGQVADASAALLELRAVLERMGAPDFYAQTCRHLEHAVGEVGARVPAIVPASPAGPALAAPDRLSPREREVLRLVASGLANQDVAAQLVVTVGTVKKHLEHIYGKLGVGSRTAAIAQARLLQQL